jgi:hypothetical protein
VQTNAGTVCVRLIAIKRRRRKPARRIAFDSMIEINQHM